MKMPSKKRKVKVRVQEEAPRVEKTDAEYVA